MQLCLCVAGVAAACEARGQAAPEGQGNETGGPVWVDGATFPLEGKGWPSGQSVEPADLERRTTAPIVFYGTSITQGGCASRPGMAATAMVGRALDVSVVNLGFSGNGRMEPALADLVGERDGCLYSGTWESASAGICSLRTPGPSQRA